MRSVCPSSMVLRALAGLALLGLPLCSAAPGSRFLRAEPGASEASLRVATEKVQDSLRSSLDAFLQSGGGESAAARGQLARIKASIWQTFQALPKNSLGRLAPRAVRHVVHAYFAKEHGWLINGLEPHGMQANVTEVQEVSILQDRAPALVEALIESRRSGRGLGLEDVVAMVAALERLILDDSVALLEAAYTLNDRSVSEPLEEGDLHEVLRSYLVVFEMGMRGNLTDGRKHRLIKQKLERKAAESWQAIVEFEQDAAMNFDYRQRQQVNPFAPAHYSFWDAAHIVEDLARAYGKWQTAECRRMTDELVALDPDGSGRVPLGVFYSQPDTADYQFSESEDYLRQIGALDDTVAGNPHVRIANYMTGPSNCIASFSHYSVCCLSDCEALMGEIEGRIQAPTASPRQLLDIVGNLSSSYVDAPRVLPEGLQQRLTAVAERHGGEVPLHGRLFAQWLHHAFPQECPYPHVHETAAVLKPNHWTEGNRSATAAKEERQRKIGEAAAVSEAASAKPTELVWSDEEVLPVHEPPRPSVRPLVAGCLRLAVQLAALLAVGRAAWTGLRAAVQSREEDAAKKDLLPRFHV